MTLSWVVLAWIQVLTYCICFVTLDVFGLWYSSQYVGEKIARDSLYKYTHPHGLGGGGYGSAHQFMPSNTHAHMQTHTNTRGGKGKPKTGKRKTRKPSSLWCENENKTRWKSKSIKYKVRFYLLSLLTQHTTKQQEKLWKFN